MLLHWSINKLVHINARTSAKKLINITSYCFFVFYLSLVYRTLSIIFTYFRYHDICNTKSRPDVKFSLYLKKAGLASRNIVRLQKIILRCVGFWFYFLYYNSPNNFFGLSLAKTDHAIKNRLLFRWKNNREICERSSYTFNWSRKTEQDLLQKPEK